MTEMLIRLSGRRRRAALRCLGVGLDAGWSASLIGLHSAGGACRTARRCTRATTFTNGRGSGRPDSVLPAVAVLYTIVAGRNAAGWCGRWRRQTGTGPSATSSASRCLCWRMVLGPGALAAATGSTAELLTRFRLRRRTTAQNTAPATADLELRQSTACSSCCTITAHRRKVERGDARLRVLHGLLLLSRAATRPTSGRSWRAMWRQAFHRKVRSARRTGADFTYRSWQCAGHCHRPLLCKRSEPGCTGVYGWLAGVVFGDASLRPRHLRPAARTAGSCLYNGGFTAGLTCCLFLPVVEAFFHTKQERRQLKTGK